MAKRLPEIIEHAQKTAELVAAGIYTPEEAQIHRPKSPKLENRTTLNSLISQLGDGKRTRAQVALAVHDRTMRNLNGEN